VAAEIVVALTVLERVTPATRAEEMPDAEPAISEAH
jgi:hypothetical protein